MSFQAPLFLVGLVVVPLLIALTVLARRRERRYVVRLPSVPTLAAVAAQAGSGRWRRLLPPVLLCLALTGLVTALARPEASVAVPVEQASVVLVTDASGSMEATDVSPTRLAAARTAAEDFLARVPEELRVGIVGYSDAPHTVTRPTQDREAVRATLAGLRADGGTATGDALATALESLIPDEPGGKRPPAAVVVLSDGATTNGRDPVGVAREAARAGIPVHTVALGTASGTVTTPDGRTQSVPPDPEALRAIASASGGRAFAAEDADALDSVYERLGSQIGTREERREVTAGFAGAGLLLLAGALGTALRWRGRLP